MLKRAPSLVEQVKSHLKERIVNAEFDSGRIPSETDLAGELNVSRNTIRDALGRLEMEGVIYRRQGAGTFVNQAMHLVKTRLEEIIPYETLIAEHGFTPTVSLLHHEEQPANPNTCHILNLEPGSKILLIEKLYLADDEPVIFSQTYLPLHLITKPYTPPQLQAPIFDTLPELCQIELAYYLSELLPVVATAQLVDTLNLPQPATAIMTFSETGYTKDNTPILRARSYFRNDMLRLRIMRRMTIT